MAYNSIQEVLNAIINAVYGVDVRQAIHDGIDMCYTNTSTGETTAQNAALSANTAATNADDKATLANMKAELADAKATLANTNALLAEKWAVGTQNGSAIASTDPAYHKDAKYSAQQAINAADLASDAAGDANLAAASANSAANSAEQQVTRVQRILGNAESALQDTTWSSFADFVTYLVSAMDDVSNAAVYADDAHDAAEDAYTATNLAEAWAVGTINNVPVPSTHPAYGKDAKTSAELAIDAADTADGATERIEAIIGDSGDTESALDQVETEIRNDPTTSVVIPAGEDADLATLILYTLEKVRRGQSAADTVETFITDAEALVSDTNEAKVSANNAAASAELTLSNLTSLQTTLTALQGELNSSISRADTATGNASTAARAIANLIVTSQEITSPDEESSATIDTTTTPYTVHFKIHKGDQGPGYTIKGDAYADVNALAADITNPAVGDMYNVGTQAPYNVYRWTGTAWEDQGLVSVSFDKITNSDINNIWSGTASSDDTKYLTLASLYYLVSAKIQDALDDKVDKDGSKVLSTNDFTTALRDKIKDNGTYDTSISTINTSISSQSTRIDTLRSAIASVYTTGSNYSVGQYCMYNDTLYRCTTAVTSAPATLETNKWTQISTAGEFTTVLGYLATVVSNFAGAYTTGQAYSVGQYCINNRQLYRCTTAIASAPATMVNANWTSVNVGDELYSAKNRLDAHKSSIAAAYNPQTTYQQGQYCIWNDQLYRCKSNMSVAAGSTLDPTLWDAVNLADDVRAATTGGVLSINGNTGVVTLGASDVQAVSYTATQTLTAAQQKKAWTNLGFPDGSGTAGTTLAVLGYVSAT